MSSSPKLDVLFEDPTLLVVNKPAGLVTDKSPTQTKDSLEDLLSRLNNNESLVRSGIVHRLDKDTSGIILVAKTKDSQDNLQSQFQDRLVKKEYLCLVHGFLHSSGLIDQPIMRNPQDREKFVTHSEGKPSITEYKPQAKYIMPNDAITQVYPEFNKIQLRKLSQLNYLQFTLVRALPKTGRTHQIRVHFKYLGYPIVSDDKYTGRKVSRLDHRWCPRQFLHAAKIEFTHPTTKQTMIFESPLPNDLQTALSLLTLSTA